MKSGHLYSDPKLQWAYGRIPMYCRMDENVLDLTDWEFWDNLDVCLDAPEFLPVGSLFGKRKYYCGFVGRGYDAEEIE